MSFVMSNGARLAYDEAGQAGQAGREAGQTGQAGEADGFPTVVLTHGGLGDRRMWDHQFRALARRGRVVRYDMRGLGESEDAEGEFSRSEDLLGLLDALDIEQAVLVGNSIGGAYSIEAALSAPERVRGLVLICSGLTEYDWPEEMTAEIGHLVEEAVPAERMARYWQRTAEYVDPADVRAIAEVNVRYMVAGPKRGLDDLVPEVRELALEMCQGNFQREWSVPRYQERFQQPPIIDRLRELAMPTLIVNGRYDPSPIQEIADLLAVRIPRARRIDLDAGHLPSIERPEETTDALLEFVAGIS
ncbi:alpha/beta fold hydrolase [Catenulispora pinisilvae]|uniref:alpha/beta fold hydrolase n=1 Tax=Catenulispora pinisilvae TaxID=2705253 RepID=UPI00189138D0|nr:alpha/beta hydrolase [Catenulispora pinisilvae]